MRTYILALGLFALAACGRSEEASNETSATPAAAPIEPGLYRQATTLLEMNDPELSEEEAAAAAKAIGSTQTADRCVTPEMIANPREMVASSAEQGCTVLKSVWDAGKIDIAMRCPETEDASGGTMTLTGNYTATAYDLDMITKGEKGEVMHMKVAAKRLGNCAK